ncbi:phosphoglycerate mutase-like protein [Suhomyces tanzawaensis NRRL Y-17324]|uniref:Phosphoglycerate mutase-like protein n=1 Tax=Suhomyces tanzawaensis NRRL Y-17324 TaxID=984487 RepID=A0A1E4SR79_9ASCO|nr:phosphoglycerate mutase-like protein [Suhomyces tanzawaensis NRRL Y-17324]ODV82005.1 phosphoglycerate mutase-like protein [Suhomyces tanzawaensis NRRL Y-17324]
MAKTPTPRVIFVRHGQTEWSKSGQYTSVTDLDLTSYGVRQMRSTGKFLIGDSQFQLIKPSNLKYVITSPRLRAKHTVELLLEGLTQDQKDAIPVIVEEDIREWTYGDYEGLLTSQIIEARAKKGLDSHLPEGEVWNIWRDGCENGENHNQVKERVDAAIAKIRALHKKAFDAKEACDIIVVGHGHILRCFAARWVGKEIDVNPQFLLDAGGTGVLSYQHNSIDEPAIFLSGAFTVPVEGED